MYAKSRDAEVRVIGSMAGRRSGGRLEEAQDDGIGAFPAANGFRQNSRFVSARRSNNCGKESALD